MAGGVNAPFLEAEETWAPTFSTAPGVFAPYLETGAGYAPSIGGGEPTGVVIRVGDTEIEEAFGVEFLDELAGAGSFRLSVPNTAATIPAHDDVVTLEVNGVAQWAGVVAADSITTHTVSEQVDENTTVSALGAIALWNRTVVQPSRGWDAVPVERTRSWSWVSVDFDASAWPASKRTVSPLVASNPEWWPDMDAWWVWANRPDVSASSAPGGRCLFRSPFTLAADATLRIFLAPDNRGTWWFDGAAIGDLDDAAYRSTQYIEIEASAGSHLLAASVLNTGRHGGMIFTIYTVDANGLLDEVVHRSDASTVDCLPYPYPNNPPYVTAGWVLRQIKEEAQAIGEMAGWTFDFTDYVDSAGNPWTPVAEVTADVGLKGFDLIESLMDWLLDAQRAPGGNVLRAWNWGTRGGTPGVTIAATTDRTTSQVEELSHDGRATRANRLRYAYRGGFGTVENAASITEYGVRPDFLDLSDIESEATATKIATAQLRNRTESSYSHNLTIAPVSAQPYVAFDNGDYVTHPDEHEDPKSSRVRSISLRENDEGELRWSLELHDIRQETSSRHENWLKRTAIGTMAGGARVANRRGEPIGSVVRVATKAVVEFSSDQVTVSTGPYRTADSSGNLVELFAEVTPEVDGFPPSSDTTVRIYKDGVFLADVTIAAGTLSNSVPLDAQKVYRNTTRFRPEVMAVGGGVRSLGVQVRAI